MKVTGDTKVVSGKQVRIIQHCEMMDRARGNAVNDIMDQMQARIKDVLDLEKPASRPVNRSVSRPAVSQSAIRPVGQPAVSRSARQSVTQSGGQSPVREIGIQSFSQSANQSTNESVSERSSQSSRRPVSRSVGQPVNQPASHWVVMKRSRWGMGDSSKIIKIRESSEAGRS